VRLMVSRETIPEVWLEQQLGVLERGLLTLRVPVDEKLLEKFKRYLILLHQGRTRVNLFSEGDLPRLARRHLLESVWWTLEVSPPSGAVVMDVGSGAGFPGIPMKLIRPDLQLLLVESRRKKALFLRRVVQALELSGVEVVNERVERVAQEVGFQGRCHYALARAVAPVPQLLAWVEPCLKRGGKLVVIKGALSLEEKQTFQDLPKTCSLSLRTVRFPLAESSEESSRWVIEIEKR